jgi:hypothetical protein
MSIETIIAWLRQVQYVARYHCPQMAVDAIDEAIRLLEDRS